MIQRCTTAQVLISKNHILNMCLISNLPGWLSDIETRKKEEENNIKDQWVQELVLWKDKQDWWTFS